ncbi:uncharacterized protein LOC120280436 [Dioscorea cayenensis subsp. rotundata]|uniref:Uncharacterized protein LOC120280436 n=1 Tax=Dioscorea cayennensis subsp. rotundata TaxID=55577 RepID=A0AB40CT26_DIOCR|nr:uncharacterized protein LOC120280436 [Dioscorea cayenensis subsp. rotundata]
MATNENAVSLSQPVVPIFTRESYFRWSLRMKTLFCSHELWELVEERLPGVEDETRKREAAKKDAKALCLIQEAVDEPILDLIAEAGTAHEAWEMIKTKFQGSSKVVAVRKQTLRQKFEMLHMQEGELIKEYLSRVVTIVNQIKAIGHKLTEEEVVGKVLRSLSSRWDYVAVAIEEAKDIAKMSMDELSGSLQAHEIRINRSSEKGTEKAFYMKGDASNPRDAERRTNRGGFRGSCRGRGRSRGRGASPERRSSGNHENRGNKSSVQCYHCKNTGTSRQIAGLKTNQ